MEPAVKNKRGFWIIFFSWISVICLLSLTPKTGIHLAKGADKLAHFVFYVPFGLIGFYHPRRNFRSVLLVSLFGINLGLLLELLQRSIPGRSCEFKDFLADALGVLTGLCVLGIRELVRRRRET